MKFIKKLIFTSIILLIVFATTTNVHAEGRINIDNINYNNFTDDELFDFEGSEYVLQDYINSIIGVDNPQPEQSLYASNTSFYMNEIGTKIMEVTGDDPIVSLVPKELFKMPNISKIHIGKEYGFYIKTKTIDNVVYSNIYLFDLINDFQESTPSHYKFIVKPLFQREYVYFEEPISYIKTQAITVGFEQGDGLYDHYLSTDITETDVVSPIPYFAGTGSYMFTENKEVYLSDVKNVINLANEQHLNYGQDGYNPYNDKGMFITQQDIEYQAKVYNVNDDNWWDATKVVINTGIGHAIDALIEEIPGASAAKEIIEACVSIKDATADELLEVGNKLTYIPKYATADAQIENYTYLAKSTVSSIGIDETDSDYGEGSYLYFDNNDYVSFDYQLSYTPVENEIGYEVPWETRVVRGFSLTFNSFNGNTSIQESDSCFLTIFDKDEREYKSLFADDSVNILPGGENLFTFIPNKSGHYSFTTNNSLYIPNLEIINYNLDINTAIVNQADIKIEAYLEKGVEYKIRLFYSEIQQFGLFDINYEFAPYDITLGDNSFELLYDELDLCQVLGHKKINYLYFKAA